MTALLLQDITPVLLHQGSSIYTATPTVFGPVCGTANGGKRWITTGAILMFCQSRTVSSCRMCPNHQSNKQDTVTTLLCVRKVQCLLLIPTIKHIDRYRKYIAST